MVPILTRAISFLTAILCVAYIFGVFSPCKKTDNANDPVKKGVEISMTCPGKGKASEECVKGVKEWEERTGNKVNILSIPADANEKLALYQQFLAAKSKNMDIFLIDVSWPSFLGANFEDLSDAVPQEEKNEHFAYLIKNNTINGRLVALPFYSEIGMLYYRKDLLEKYNEQVPQTWEQLTATADRIQKEERALGNKKMWGYIFQGKASEALTVNALEWIYSFKGGLILDEVGKITINNPQAKKALQLAESWVGTISPEGVSNYNEEDGRGVFQPGNAVFLRNWSYVFGLVNTEDSAVKGKVGIARLPKGGDDGQYTGALGGQQLAVSKYSRHKAEAIDLIKHLTSAKEQKRKAISSSYLPTRPALYQDAEILAKNPHFTQIYPLFGNAIMRPSKQTGLKYSQVSKEFFMTVHGVLSKRSGTIEDKLKSLQDKIEAVLASTSK